MKKLLMIVSFVFGAASLSGQSIELSGIISSANINEFKNASGFEAGFEYEFSPKSRVAISFSLISKNTDYDLVYDDSFMDYPPDYYYFNRVNSAGSRDAIKASYGWELMNKERTSIFVGPLFSLNYYSLRRDYDVIELCMADSSVRQFENSKREAKRNLLGAGLFVELSGQITSSPGLWVFTRLSFEQLDFGEILLGGYTDPGTISSFSVNAGIRYCFKKK